MNDPFDGKNWQVAAPITPQADSGLAIYPPYFRQILFNRGIADAAAAENFLFARSGASTDPFRLMGMQTGVERLSRAVDEGEPVAVYGDYDVDGVTATALLVQVLRALGGNAREYIPNRFEEGYGLNNDALQTLSQQGVRVVVTVDCGIRSWDEVAYGAGLGLDMIVTDHHSPLDRLPQALAVINPKQDGDPYPDKDLAGVGLAYKLAQALIQYRKAESVGPEEWLDLVALGTVADLAPLVGENRVLVRKGLERIRAGGRLGLRALAAAAGLTLARTSAVDIGFILGPRLNAAGRVESATAAYRLLVTADGNEAGLLAQELDDQNHKRKYLTRTIQAKAETLALAENPNPLLIFAADPEFNAGVVGLAASRLMETHYRPSIVAFKGEEFTRGSCRSIPEFHITQALDRCADLLVRHGGHAAAAGFTIRNDRLPQFLERLNAIAADELGQRELKQVLYADMEIPLSELKPDMLQTLESLQPTGYGNPEPAFISRGLRVRTSRAVGKDASHLKLTVSDDQVTRDAIAFRFGHLLADIPGHVDLLYRFELNEYMGMTTLQLNVKDIKPAQ